MRKSNPNERITSRPSSKFAGRDVTLEKASCNTDLLLDAGPVGRIRSRMQDDSGAKSTFKN